MKPRRSWLVWAAVLLSACSPASSPSGSTPSDAPSASPSASPADTVAPSPSATATSTPASGDALAVDSLVEVLVSDLVVRSDPGIEPPSTIHAARLAAPDRALVVDGPVEASGYEWYLVAPLIRADGSRGPFGWIARASREGEPWVRATEVTCPSPVDLAGVLALQPLERLACFGDETLTLEAPVVGCGAGGGPWTFDPAWLSSVGGCGLALDTSGSAVLIYREPPGGSAGPTAGPATVTGHFDDPAARGCTVTSTDPVAFPAPSPEEAVVLCRTEFVLGAGS